MPKTLMKSRLHSNKHKPKIKQEIYNTKSNLLPHLQPLNKNYFQEMLFYFINELR